MFWLGIIKEEEETNDQKRCRRRRRRRHDTGGGGRIERAAHLRMMLHRAKQHDAACLPSFHSAACHFGIDKMGAARVAKDDHFKETHRFKETPHHCQPQYDD